MKAFFFIVLLLFSVQTLSAQPAGFSAEKKSAIANNLVKAINSENTGLHTSGAIVLADLINESYMDRGDASKAMIPLLRLLKNGETEKERIAAAVALYQLGNPIGIFQLGGVARFDDNKKVAAVCKNLYYTYHTLNGTEYLVSF